MMIYCIYFSKTRIKCFECLHNNEMIHAWWDRNIYPDLSTIEVCVCMCNYISQHHTVPHNIYNFYVSVKIQNLKNFKSNGPCIYKHLHIWSLYAIIENNRKCHKQGNWQAPGKEELGDIIFCPIFTSSWVPISTNSLSLLLHCPRSKVLDTSQWYICTCLISIYRALL